MKKLLSLFLLIFLSSTSILAQSADADQITMDRKIRRAVKAEARMASIPVSIEELDNVIFPEIAQKKLELAPHMPEYLNLKDEALHDTLEQWITDYPMEYNSYLKYLEEKFRSYR